MSQAETIAAKPSELRTGSTIQHPIHDAHGILLLAAGTLITDKIIQHLISRQIHELHLHPADAGSVRQQESAPERTQPRLSSAVNQLSQTIAQVVKNTGPPVKEHVAVLGCTPYDHGQTVRLTDTFRSTTAAITALAQDLLDGANHDAGQLARLATTYVAEMVTDTDNVLTTTAALADDPLLAERCVRMAVLSMAMGIELGFDQRHVRELGVCGLVHDWGVFQLPERFRDPHEPFTRDDWLHYMTHPQRTLKLLEQMTGISDSVLVAVPQIHELIDGSGYPKGLRKERIHPYAKVLSIVDVHISLTSPIRGRPAFIPYDAMKYLLTNVKNGRFDTDGVRALLHVLSLFPIGSRVQLSDGTQAKVIRRNGENYTKPIVERIRVDGGPDQPSLVDLAVDNLAVQSAVPTPHRKEMRIDEALMSEILWDAPAH